MDPLRAFASLALAVALATYAPARAQADTPADGDDTGSPPSWEDDAPPPPPDYGQQYDEDDRQYGDDEQEEEDDGGRDEAPPPEQYESNLAPYGGWYVDPTYGRVWQPRVAYGWAPYVDGRWTWSPWGWTWMSWEPWAWTFHYGRWAWVGGPGGWVWVPGYVWGPAWVDWYWGDGFVGWAPLSPFGTVVVNHFHWVHERDFCAPHLHDVMLHRDHVPHDVFRNWNSWHGRRPDHGHIEHVSRFQVPMEHRRPSQTLAPWHHDRGTFAHRGDVDRRRGDADGRGGGIDHRRGNADGRGGGIDHRRGDIDRRGGGIEHRGAVGGRGQLTDRGGLTDRGNVRRPDVARPGLRHDRDGGPFPRRDAFDEASRGHRGREVPVTRPPRVDAPTPRGDAWQHGRGYGGSPFPGNQPRAYAPRFDGGRSGYAAGGRSGAVYGGGGSRAPMTHAPAPGAPSGRMSGGSMAHPGGTMGGGMSHSGGGSQGGGGGSGHGGGHSGGFGGGGGGGGMR